MKKFRNLIYSIIMVGVLMSTIILSSFSQADKVLLNAEEITKKLLEVGLAEDEELGYISTSYVKGLDGNEDYILAVCETGGYAIYEKETYELIEYSPIGTSPYNQIAENDSYYAGPVNYFKKVDNNYESLTTHEKISVSSGKAIALNLKGKLQTDRESRKQQAEKDVIENETAIQSAKGNEAISLTNNISTEEVNFNKRPADNYGFYNRNYLDNYQFFIDNIYFGKNYAGSCSSVATQLFLTYYDWCIDGRLIPFKTGETGNQFVTYTEQDYSIRANIYGADMRGTTSTYSRTDGVTTFYEYIMAYVNPSIMPEEEWEELGKPDVGGAGLSDIEGFLNYYFINQNQIDARDISIQRNSNGDKSIIINQIITCINNNKPAIVSMVNYEEDEGVIISENHALVVYGYQDVVYQNQTINGFIANFGWHQIDYTNVWFNADWVNGYLSLDIEHTHNLTEFIISNSNVDGHLLECLTCKAVLPSDRHNYNRNAPVQLEYNNILRDRYHYTICSCGLKEKEYHLFTQRYLDNSLDPHTKSLYHTKKCNCGYTMNEGHWYKSGNTTCMYCGYVSSGGGII